MLLAKNKKIFSLLAIVSINLVALLALVALPRTALAQTPPACQSETSVRAIEACVAHVNQQIQQQCSGRSADAAERCAQDIRNGSSTSSDPDSNASAGEVVNPFAADDTDVNKQCGKGDSTYVPIIDIGCQGQEYKPGEPNAQLNPIMDLLFALLRFLTVGVGIVAIGSIIVAGIQFTTSQGEPAGTAKAIGRISTTVGALFLYLLAWALLNWLVPGGIFNG